MDEELQKTLKYLRLYGLLARWDEMLAEVKRKRYSAERLLRHVFEAERRIKNESARQLRRKRAHIPELLEIETENAELRRFVLRNIVLKQSKVGDAQGALAAAEKMHDAREKARALAHIATTLAEKGDVKQAVQVTQQIKDVTSNAVNCVPKHKARLRTDAMREISENLRNQRMGAM